jgi:FixJ family two-component response regulator
VVLPGESGRELADRIKRLYPHLPVLFTTGYTRNAIVHQGRLDPRIHLLNKPYTQQDLARKVRDLLDV